MTPRSRGRVTLASPDSTVAPRIDIGYLTDPGEVDLRVLMSGIELARDFARHKPLADWIGQELPPTANGEDAETIRHNVLHYYHPVGTCKMGPPTDPDAVVNVHGRVYGLDNLYVADASLMPVIPHANTNIPTLVVAERVAAGWAPR